MLIRVDPQNPKESMIKAASGMASMGELIIFPTDTIYGIGTSSYSQAGVMRHFASKKRSQTKPLGVFMSGIGQLVEHCVISEAQERFLSSIWPGPVTCVFLRQPKSMMLTTPLKTQPPTVAVRIPDNLVCKMLVGLLGHPLLQTSVNISGLPHGSHNELLYYYERFADAMIDGGPEKESLPSTVINLSGPDAKLVREGSVSWESLKSKLLEFGIGAID